MITLKNGTRGRSKIGYVAKSSSKDGYFEYARFGDSPIGIVTQEHPTPKEVEIAHGGELKVYLHKKAYNGDIVIMTETDGAPAGTCVPLRKQSNYIIIGTALEDGRGLIKVNVALTTTPGETETTPGIPSGGSTGQFLSKSSGDSYDVEWTTASGTGDMLSSVYDPDTISDDAFDMDNMKESSTNKIFTSTERSKLSAIAAGAEVNVNADWDATSGDSEILNKPAGILPTNDQIVAWAQGKNYEPGTITRDSEGRITSMTVVWPDDSAGTYTATDYNATHEVYDGYTITHTDSAQTVTQSAVTRNSDGAVTTKPALTIS